MPSFWQAVPTIKAIFGETYKAFPLFGSAHLGELGVCLLLGLAVFLVFRRADAAKRKRILWVITALLLIDEIIKHAAMLGTGQWSLIYLPLHLCSINIFVCLYHCLRGGKVSAEILYALCLPGALIALLSPSWQAAPLWNIMHLHSESVHFLLALYPVLLLAGGFRPDFRRFPRVCGFLLIVSVPMFFINRALDTNFFFLNDPDANAITRAFAAVLGDKLYFLGFPAALCVLALFLYLPWEIARRQAACSVID